MFIHFCAVEVILNRQNIKENGYKDVVASSLRKASDWGQRSGMFKATETFLAEMRQEKDRYDISSQYSVF